MRHWMRADTFTNFYYYTSKILSSRRRNRNKRSLRKPKLILSTSISVPNTPTSYDVASQLSMHATSSTSSSSSSHKPPTSHSPSPASSNTLQLPVPCLPLPVPCLALPVLHITFFRIWSFSLVMCFLSARTFDLQTDCATASRCSCCEISSWCWFIILFRLYVLLFILFCFSLSDLSSFCYLFLPGLCCWFCLPFFLPVPVDLPNSSDLASSSPISSSSSSLLVEPSDSPQAQRRALESIRALFWM